jgi:hypothetical protein
MGNRFDPADRHTDATVEAIRVAAHRIATALNEGFALMADAQAQALADLSDAITKIGTAIAAEITALQNALAKQGVDDSPEIEARVSQLSALTNALTNSIPADVPPAPAPTPTPGA